MASRPLFSIKSCLRAFSASPTAIVGGEVHSTVYRQSMIRPPPTVNCWWRDEDWSWCRHKNSCWWRYENSCSFIGTVVTPVKRCAVDMPRAYTRLEVKGPPTGPNPSSFQLLLEMRDKLATVSLKYLNPDNCIYVRGPLTYYERSNGNDSNAIFYKVIVNELNFVIRPGQKSMEPESSIEEESTTPTSRDNEDEYLDRLRLWQIFFANPYEWWDNRHKKLHPRSPDFKHKDTHECLWLRPDDPPWVQRQLELYDSNMPTPSSRSKMRVYKTKDLF